MNLAEYFENDFKVFSRMSDDNRRKHIDIIQYIDILANQSGIDVSNWDIATIFGAGKGNALITDRNEVNKVFFDTYQKMRAEKPVEADSLEGSVQRRINDISAKIFARELAKIEQQRDVFQREAKQYYDEFQKRLHRAWEQTLTIESLRGKQDSDFASQIDRIAKENFWGDPVVEGSWLYLVTKNDIVIIHKNPAAGIDVRINFGRFAAKIDLETMNLRVIPLDNNIRNAAGFFHPYVDTGGTVCFGNAGDTAGKLLARGDIVGIMRLLANLLRSWSDDSTPHAGLQTFLEKEGARRIDLNDPSTYPPVFQQERAEREKQLEKERQYREQMKAS